MARLPGHWAPRFTPENATAQTTPSRLTMVAHIWLLRPLVSVAVALASAACSSPCDGRPVHLLPPSSSPARTARDSNNPPPARTSAVTILFCVDVLMTQ